MSEILHIPIYRALADRVRWLIKLRWAVLLVIFVGTLLGHRVLADMLPMNYLYAAYAAIALVNAFSWVIAYRLVSPGASYQIHSVLMQAQVIADLFSLTALLHFSGGLENPASTFYPLLVLMGSILLTRRASYLYATLATVLWFGLLLAEASGLLPHYNLTGFRLPIRYSQPMHIVAEGLVVGCVSFAVAALSSSIIDQVRRGEHQLYEANARCKLRAGELAELNRRLQELDQTRTLLVRLVTHELRAPVAAIQSYLRLILEGYVPQERIMEIIEKAERRAREQLDLISDLLDLARLQQGKGKPSAQAADAAAVLKDVLDMMQASVQDKSLSLEINVAEAEYGVRCSPEHMKQVWTNLVSNAVRYTPSGGDIYVDLRIGDSVVCGAVRDTGIGMAPDELGHIFENFYRTPKAKEMVREGTGLGLSIVRGIMERYGGRVWAESELGKGSSFHFELPRALSDSDSP